MSDAADTSASLKGVARDAGGGFALWVCNRCGHVYDPSEGEPHQGIPPGVPFEHLGGEWLCPHCGAPPSLFFH